MKSTALKQGANASTGKYNGDNETESPPNKPQGRPRESRDVDDALLYEVNNASAEWG